MRSIALVIFFGTLLTFMEVWAAKKEPGLLILCESGVVQGKDSIGELATGINCVVHDKSGGTRSTYSITVYDNGESEN
jgi:hypothetical protein